MKYGLVMEGGAMRGIFSAGVMDVLMENGVDFDGLIGVSAGACFGCNYKSKQSGRVIRYNLRFCKDKRYCSLHSLITTGDMFGAEFCYDTIPNKLDLFDSETYVKNPMKFYVNATDVESGKPVYHCLETVEPKELEWIRASASMPMAARIVNIDGKKLLDGGIADSIPLKFMEHSGYDKNVVILTQPRDFVKKSGKSASMIKFLYRKYPNLVNVYLNRPKIYNEQLAHIRRSEKNGTAFVIAPPEKLPIGHIEHDRDKLLEVYRIGRNTARKRLPELLKFMSK